MADLLSAHHNAVQRLAEVRGLGVDSAQQIIAEVGATAATFPSSKHLASWMGACPGNEESARRELPPPLPQRQSADATCPQPSRQCRGEGKRDHLQRGVPPARPASGPCPGDRCRYSPALSVDLEDLHERVRYEERGPAVSQEAEKMRARKMICELRSLGYRVELLPAPSSSPA